MVDVGKVTSPAASWSNKQRRKPSIKKSLRRDNDKRRESNAQADDTNDQDGDRPEDAHFDGFA